MFMWQQGNPIPKHAKKSGSDCVTETEIVSMDLDYPSDLVTADPNPESIQLLPLGYWKLNLLI